MFWLENVGDREWSGWIQVGVLVNVVKPGKVVRQHEDW